ncbi:NAD dependent epimerase/dehydratase family protein [mine drainage metagenome]|uniref:NAD dependent epimerase/dehydratase family protein n=1 Tax=mine drainage metagenome TaxID=410659 RepID=A0A1J5RKS6_9ZZZZ
MQRLLIIGCGDVARRSLPLLAGRYRLYALVRAPDEALDAELARFGVTAIRGDLDRPATLARLSGLADLVLHFAPPPASGTDGDPRTRRLIAALRRGKILPRRLVYISTTGIYGDCGGAVIDETSPPRPQTARARRRVDAETELRRWGRLPGGPNVSILRAPGIYAANRLPLERIRRHDPVLAAGDDVFTNHIHGDDLARAALAALRRGRPNRAYHASDDSALRMAEWFDAVADAFDLPHPPRVGRAEAERLLAPTVLSFMRESRRLDNRRLKRELGMHLSYPTAAAGLAAIRKES